MRTKRDSHSACRRSRPLERPWSFGEGRPVKVSRIVDTADLRRLIHVDPDADEDGIARATVAAVTTSNPPHRREPGPARGRTRGRTGDVARVPVRCGHGRGRGTPAASSLTPHGSEGRRSYSSGHGSAGSRRRRVVGRGAGSAGRTAPPGRAPVRPRGSAPTPPPSWCSSTDACCFRTRTCARPLRSPTAMTSRSRTKSPNRARHALIPRVERFDVAMAGVMQASVDEEMVGIPTMSE